LLKNSNLRLALPLAAFRRHRSVSAMTNILANRENVSRHLESSDGSNHLDVLSSPADPIKVALFIRNFRIGGTERQVFELAKNLDKRKYEVVVIALHGDGELKKHFHSLPNLQVAALACKHPIAVLFRLAEVMRKREIKVLHSFLTATNIYSLFAKLFFPRVKVVIGLRDSVPDFYMGYNSLKWRTKLWILEYCLSGLSGLGDLYVSNSQAGKILYERKFRTRVVAVPNGVDTDRFRPDSIASEGLRRAVGLPASARLVGILANCTIYKDYPTFVRAAKIIVDRVRDVHFISIGEERTVEGVAAKGLVQQSGLENVFHFLGARRDVTKLLPGLDVVCSSSVTEGFPNAIIESMACGVPCVVTDVGDSRKIVGDTGIVVSPGNPGSLAAGVIEILDLDPVEKQELSSRTRERVVQNFGAVEMANQHAQLYESLLSGATLKV
jgi:glycosyltransferase involved in cell wall biosynthesis